MQLNNIELISYNEMLNEATFILKCDLSTALALDGQILTITSQNKEYKIFAGYNVMSVGVQGDYTALRVYRKLEADTEAAINAADANAKTAIAEAESLKAENADLQAQVEEQALAIEELATMLAEMEV